MSKPQPVAPSDEPVNESEEDRRERIYKAVSNHINEITNEYIREIFERRKAARVVEAPAQPDGLPGVPLAPAADETDELAELLPDRMRLNTQLGRKVLAGITEIIFTAALKDGYFRFPDGFGSFSVQRLTPNPKPKRLPTGDIVPMPPNRVKFKYEDGAAVREALGLSKKTNYVRRYKRESRLSKKTLSMLRGE